MTTSSLWFPFQQLVYPHPPGLNMMIFHNDVPISDTTSFLVGVGK